MFKLVKFSFSHIIVSILLSVILFSCGSNYQEVVNVPIDDTDFVEVKNTLTEDEKIYEDDEKEEVFVIENKTVVFFVLSKKELRQLNRELGDSYRYETDYLFNNFNRQSKNFKKILAKHDIKSDLIHNKSFLIKLKNGKTVSFNRVREDQIMGEIISDGIQEPLIQFGMYTNKELLEMLNNYFKIENDTIEDENDTIKNESDTLQLPVEEKMNVDTAVVKIE
ncbi:MAG: hypothetical protein B6I20_05315 [Bacteroidetes bacterium 4572_117]|nr:MAG: hypothetical protein B6I20_05315 [Bacteroidetes bacterium 4572_117]